MKRALLLLLLLPGYLLTGRAQSKTKNTPDYFPPAGSWQHPSPSSMGLDSLQLQEAIRFARDKEAKASALLPIGLTAPETNRSKASPGKGMTPSSPRL